MRKSSLVRLLFIATVLAASREAAAQDPNLEARLKGETPAALAKAARAAGDAARGAVLFHQSHVMCLKCHVLDGSPAGFGPDLTALPRETTDEQIVESILEPSKVIRKGFELFKIATSDGQTLLGLIAEDSKDRLILRDPAPPGKTTAILRAEIESRSASPISAMPTDLANQLASRQQFLDLVRYVTELRDGGRGRAAELAPSAAALALELPAYESHIDHAGLIRSLDKKALSRGKAIYERLCINCHGTVEQPGSLPTSLRFASGKFKSGSDPLAMYQTLTRGFGLMAPQGWMVPQQKYDVIHYIRQEFLLPLNASQHFAVTEDYLASLPKGDTRGPAPQKYEPWATMDYGPSLIHTYEFGEGGRNIAQKGIAVRLDTGQGGIARGKAWMVFEHDTLRWAGAWTGKEFIDWNGIQFNGKHQVHPRVVGDVCLQNDTGPGWADPATGSLADDQRVIGRDGRRYGPLPSSWGKFRGLYHYEDRVVVSYTVGSTEVLESSGSLASTAMKLPILTRTLQLGPRDRDLLMVVASSSDPQAVMKPLGAAVRFGLEGASSRALLVGIGEPDAGCNWVTRDNRLCLRIPTGSNPLRLTLWMTPDGPGQSGDAVSAATAAHATHGDLAQYTHGGPPRWPQKLTTKAARGTSSGPFAVDVLTHPQQNPWLAQLRFTGLDFIPGGDRALLTTWDGDVWLVNGLSQLDASGSECELTWQRIASGLFQPLGIKLVNDKIYVTCRDQLVVLHDLNGDRETDFYECFNSDHQVTEHFHEFAMGLQVDSQGNFYYAKSARHALPAVVPHHGTLLRVAADGSRTDILANGFRAANGVCLNADGTFVVTDQEGHWNPKNRINWVVPGKFYGNMFGYHDVTDASDAAMERPLCWITNTFDRSPGELLWVPQNAWGSLGGQLLNLSYGTGKLFVVPFEDVKGQKQGGMCALPFGPLPTGVMRGRFSPTDGQLYCCGMFAWAGSATQPGGAYRIRYTGEPMYLPTGFSARRGQIELTFTDPLDRAAASDIANYGLKTWSLKRTANYGSDHYNEQPLETAAAKVSADGRTVTLSVPQLQPTWCIEVSCRLVGADGTRHQRVLHGSIYQFAEPSK